MTIGLGHYLTVAAILFTIGIFGIFLNRKNVIIILMSIVAVAFVIEHALTIRKERLMPEAALE